MQLSPVQVEKQLLCMYSLVQSSMYPCIDTTKSNIVSDTVTSDEPASADLSGKQYS